MRSGKVFYNSIFAGIFKEDDDGYIFEYDDEYLKSENAEPISLTLPLGKKYFSSKTMIPFFDGLIPEGWLLEIIEKNWKLDRRDRMGLLLLCCKDCIGAVSIISEED